MLYGVCLCCVVCVHAAPGALVTICPVSVDLLIYPGCRDQDSLLMTYFVACNCGLWPVAYSAVCNCYDTRYARLCRMYSHVFCFLTAGYVPLDFTVCVHQPFQLYRQFVIKYQLESEMSDVNFPNGLLCASLPLLGLGEVTGCSSFPIFNSPFWPVCAF